MNSSVKKINSDNKNYIIEPFTIDCRGARILDDGFYIAKDDDGNISLNICISLIGIEYMTYAFDDLLISARSTKIKDYIGDEKLQQYSLSKGTRRVLTLQIIPLGRELLFKSLCEEIPIVHNFSFDDKINSFEKYFKNILHKFNFVNNEDIVHTAMVLYSSTFSQYLSLNGIDYIITDKSKIDTRFGSFTSPLRNKPHFLNQFLYLQLLQSMIEEPCDDLSLLKDDQPNVAGQSLVLRKSINHNIKM